MRGVAEGMMRSVLCCCWNAFLFNFGAGEGLVALCSFLHMLRELLGVVNIKGAFETLSTEKYHRQ